MPRFVFLYGPSGSGKSSIGQRLAETLQLPFLDIDALIETMARLPIPDIFKREGEAGFREREKAALASVLGGDQDSVVSLGGGALVDPENRSHVEEVGEILFLTAPLETLAARLEKAETQARPLLAGDLQTRLAALLAERQDHYASFGNRLETGGLDLEGAVWQAQLRSGNFHVRGMGEGYDVRAYNGALSELGLALRSRGLHGPIALVSDRNVWTLYGLVVRESLESAGYRVQEAVIPPGEVHKTITTVEKVWPVFLRGRLERASTVVALGGGVVGDLAGFAAATYMRGIAWVAVPTSLLAMVDASLGGKTGVDLPQGKNLVGAFHPPRLVWTDPSALATLPAEELCSGLAEVVKHGVIGDPALFDLCTSGLESLQHDWAAVVRRAMAVKIRLIQEDPYEQGPRAALNLGHTVGHALEHASGFKLRHGEAVAMGMVVEARLAARLGYAEPGLAGQLATTLKGLGLPVEPPLGLDRAEVLRAMGRDKKKTGGTVRFALPCRVGDVQVGVPVMDLEEVFVEGGE